MSLELLRHISAARAVVNAIVTSMENDGDPAEYETLELLRAAEELIARAQISAPRTGR